MDRQYGAMAPVPKNRSQLESLLADKVPSALLAVTIGEFVGGPVGPFVAAAAAPVIEYVVKRGNDKYVEGAQAVFAAAADAAGRPLESLPAYLDEDDRRLDVAVTAVRAALNTLDRNHLDALARVLAYGLSDDCRLEVAGLYLAAMRELRPPHVRVLHHLVTADQDDSRWVGRQESELRLAFPGLASGLDAIVATLVREGLAAHTLIDGGDAAGVGDQGWSATDFGTSTYEWFRGASLA